MVEGTPLLRAQMVMSCLVGSNPILSATYPRLPGRPGQSDRSKTCKAALAPAQLQGRHGHSRGRKIFHSFRNTLKTALARHGVNRNVSDLITGHKDQSVGGIYIGDLHVTMIEAMGDDVNRVEIDLSRQFFFTVEAAHPVGHHTV